MSQKQSTVNTPIALAFKQEKNFFSSEPVILAEAGREDCALRQAAQVALEAGSRANFARYRTYFDFRGADVEALESLVAAELRGRAEYFDLYRRGQVKTPYSGAKALEDAGSKYNEPYGFPALVLDLDTSKTRDELGVVQDTRLTLDWFRAHGVPHQVFSSGNKGYHLEVPAWALNSPTHPRCAEVVKRLLAALSQEILGKPDGYDLAMVHRGGLIRLQHVQREIRRDREGNRIEEPPRFKTPVLRGCEIRVPNPLCHERREWLPPLPAGEPNPALLERWEAAAARVRSTSATASEDPAGVEPLPDGLPYWAGALPGGRRWEGLERLALVFGLQEGASKASGVQCPHPAHEDDSPSAVYFAESGNVYCSACNRTYPPHQVAAWKKITGVKLARRSSPPQVKPTRAQLDLEHAAKRAELAALLEQLLDNQDPDLISVVRASTGLGKSVGLSRALARRCGVGALVLSATHGLSREFAQRAEEDRLIAALKQEPWEQEPRCNTVRFRKGALELTGREHLELAGGVAEPRRLSCARCPLRKECSFLVGMERLKEHAGDGGLVLGATANLRNRASLRQLAGANRTVVVDEDALSALSQVEAYSLGDLRAQADRAGGEYDVWEDYVPVPRQSKARAWLEEVVAAAEANRRWVPAALRSRAEEAKPDWRSAEASSAATVAAQMAIPALLAGLDGQPAEQVSLAEALPAGYQDFVGAITAEEERRAWDGHSTSERRVAIDIGWTGLPEVLGFDDTLSDDLRELNRLANQLRDPSGLLGLRLALRPREDGGEDLQLVIHRVAQGLDDLRLILLDATISDYDARLISLITGKRVEIHDLKASNPLNKLVHDPSGGYSRTWAQDPAGARYQRSLDFVKRLAEEVGSENLGLAGRKGCAWLEDARIRAGLEEDAILTYGRARGRNSLQNKQALVIMGDPAPDPWAYYLAAMARLDYSEVPPVVMRAGLTQGPSQSLPHYRVGFPAFGPNPEARAAGRAAYAAVMSAELEQMAGRLRLLQGEGRTVYLLSAQHPGPAVGVEYGYEIDPSLLWRGDAEAGVGVDPKLDILDQDLLGELPPTPTQIRDAEILRLQQEEGLTQAQISKRVGVSQDTVGRVLRAAGVRPGRGGARR